MLDKLKELSRETVIYGISTVLGRFLNFILVPFHSNIFQPSDMGVVSNIYSYIALFNIIFIYGMDSAYLKMGSLPEFKGTKKVFSTSYIIIFITSVVFGVLFLAGMGGVSSFLGIEKSGLDPAKFHRLIMYGVGILFFDVLTVIPFITLRLQNKSLKFSQIRVANILINIALNLVLILVLKMDIEAIFIANFAASVFSFVMLVPVIRENLELKTDGRLAVRIFKFGLPFMPAGLAAMLTQVVDKPILEKLTDFKTLGIYQQNYKLSMFMMLYVSMFQYAWQPFFLKYAEDEGAGELFSKVFTYFTIAGSFILLFITVFLDEIVGLNVSGFHLLGKAYWSGLYIVPVVLLGYLFYGFYINFNAAFYIKEKSLPVPLLLGAGALINIAMNFALIPLIGIMGAALATLFAYLFIAAAFYIGGQKTFKIPYENKKIAVLLALIVISMAVYYLFIFGKEDVMFTKAALITGFIMAVLLADIISPREARTFKNLISGRLRRR